MEITNIASKSSLMARLCLLAAIISIALGRWVDSSAFLAVATLALSIIALLRVRHSNDKVRGKGTAITAICICLLALVVCYSSFLSRVQELRRRSICQENLRAIAEGLRIYAKQDPDGRFPANLKQLAMAGIVSEKALTCPGDPEYSISYQCMICSSDNAPQIKNVWICELPRNHGNEGSNVLYTDGHVSFEKLARLKDLLGETAP